MAVDEREWALVESSMGSNATMVFDTITRIAYLTPRPNWGIAWKNVGVVAK